MKKKKNPLVLGKLFFFNFKESNRLSIFIVVASTIEWRNASAFVDSQGEF